MAISTADLKAKLAQHVKWLARESESDGVRLNLSGANLRGMSLSHADLSYANLEGANLSHVELLRADLSCADLTGANLRSAGLRYADLTGANLRCANLTGADMRGVNLCYANLTDADLGDLDIPVVPNIDAAILEAIGDNPDRLNMVDWHICKTTHCRAGWAITLAGKVGRDLEEQIGSAAAGALIYAVSRPGKPIPSFFATNVDALADIRESAASA